MGVSLSELLPERQTPRARLCCEVWSSCPQHWHPGLKSRAVSHVSEVRGYREPLGEALQ